jgi:hypothetical protein
MTTIVAAAVGAIVAALQSAPAVAPTVARVRLRPLAHPVATAVVVRPLQTEVTQASLQQGYPVSWASQIAVECYAKSTAATSPDVAVDALLEAVYARLFTDPALVATGLLTLEPKEVSFDFDADGDQTTCATLVITARHRALGISLS